MLTPLYQNTILSHLNGTTDEQADELCNLDGAMNDLVPALHRNVQGHSSSRHARCDCPSVPRRNQSNIRHACVIETYASDSLLPAPAFMLRLSRLWKAADVDVGQYVVMCLRTIKHTPSQLFHKNMKKGNKTKFTFRNLCKNMIHTIKYHVLIMLGIY